MAGNQNSGSGGKRPGAGRKPSTLNMILKRIEKDDAALILAKIEANSKWLQLAKSRNERIRLEVLKYLTDRAFGKAPQSMDLNHSGELEVIKRVVVDV